MIPRSIMDARDRVLGKSLRGMLALPAPLLRRMAGTPRVSDRGVPLDLQTQAMLVVTEPIRRPPKGRSPRRARAETDWQARVVGRAVPCARVEEGTLPGAAGPLPYRVYVPHGEEAPWPLLVYYHGGGWVIGSLDSHDAVCRLLAVEGRCVVLSVEYRLAPEHRFPAAIEDAVAAYRWARRHAASLRADPERVAVGGDSAGGNLAAQVCLEERRASRRMPDLQVLIYPGTDLTRACPSHRTFAEGYYLDQETMDWFLDHYLADPAQARDPRCSPLFEPDLSKLPPAHVITAGFDPLRDEGEAYAHKLEQAGVAVDLRCEEALIHGFANMNGIIDAADAACRSVGRRLGDALRR
ncbi:MAG: alpha/beta hydrolase fold domain-containing protein [Myxococcota bacterium]